MVYFYCVAFEDDVFFLEACFCCGAFGNNAAFMCWIMDNKRAIIYWEIHFPLKYVVHNEIAYAKEWFSDAAVGLEVMEIPPRGIDRDRKADILCAKDNGGIDADCGAIEAHEGASRVPRINRSVGLNKSAEFLRSCLRVGLRGD